MSTMCSDTDAHGGMLLMHDKAYFDDEYDAGDVSDIEPLDVADGRWVPLEEERREPRWRHFLEEVTYENDLADTLQLIRASLGPIVVNDLDANGWRYFERGVYTPNPGHPHGKRKAYTPCPIDVTSKHTQHEFLVARAYLSRCTEITDHINWEPMDSSTGLCVAARTWWATMTDGADDSYVGPGVFICAMVADGCLTETRLPHSARNGMMFGRLEVTRRYDSPVYA